MSRRFRIPHPLAIYSIMLVVVIVVSWIGSVYETRGVTSNSDIMLRSLLDPQGIRWMFRNVSNMLDNAPVADSLLLLMGAGILKTSGIRMPSSSSSLKERFASALALFVFAICLLLIAVGLFMGNHVLLGVTGNITGSPFLRGFFMLLFLCVLFPSIAYGFASDNLRSGADVIRGFTCFLPRYASFFVTLPVAALLLDCMDYSNMYALLSIGTGGVRITRLVVYLFPFIYSSVAPQFK